MAGQRPGGVTLVAVLAWLNGAIAIISGIIHLFGEGFGSLPAWLTIVIGAITIAVSLGLFRGSNTSRIIMTVVFVLNAAIAVYGVFTFGNGFWGPLIQGIIALIGLGLLWSRKANEFFD
ncbi:hypothetical protein GCM10017608_14230 [Agromyces luteolus]|uniref:Uncharacterized protein n=2 Tax=Agromyces luteolus TaxID=88373 RepID=A0A7C9HIE2_9MICO|nr:hypothetical protein [Agromyces luteolus]MUN07721.1 hypothetical protein [Agromyces luteolus]GLK27489.1 hypothetical protein GCM10017608_14230 [Agromyces luteolus]